MRTSLPLRSAPFLALAAALVFLGYGPARSESVQLLSGFAIAFAAYVWTVRSIQLEWRQFIYLAIGLRLALFLAPITWTDDHFRYIWDGLCTIKGISPFAFTPADLLAKGYAAFTQDHFERLNSPLFHSVYPPVAQAIFAISAWVGQGDLWGASLTLRAIVIACDLLAILALGTLLRTHPRRVALVALYALNPLVIMEFTVNLHTEIIMIAPSLMAVTLLRTERYIASACLLAIAAAAKLWPLLFLAWIPSRLGIKRSILPILLTISLFTLFWIPFRTPEMVGHILSSLRLYYEYLEFNGALFEGLRRLLGDGPVKGTGLLLGITLIGLAIYSIRLLSSPRVYWPTAMLWLLAIHLFGSQAVHPWYILPLVAFSVLTDLRWPILWTLLIVPTYLTYRTEPHEQPYGWIAIEYGVLFIFMILERKTLHWRKVGVEKAHHQAGIVEKIFELARTA